MMVERNLGLSSRNENTRNSLIPDMHISKLDEMFRQFQNNTASIKNKFAVAERLFEIRDTDGAKDIYRSQIVFLESALDFYMHSLGIYAMEQMYNGNWEKTAGYKDLKVPIDKVMDAIGHPEDTSWINDVIVSYHSSKTYMSPGEIKGQLTLILGQGFYKKVADKMYYDRNSHMKTEKKLTKKLQDLFDRRNKIVHQADRNHKSGEEYDIDRQEVAEAIECVELFVNSVHELLHT